MAHTAKLCAMLVCILGSFLVSHSRNIKQAIDARLDGICALIAEFKGLLCIGCVFIDHLVNQILDRRYILRCTELEQSVRV